jgi:hypothetical protein
MNVLEIHGPSYCYSGEVLTEPTLIWVADHHYNSDNDQPYAVKTLVDNSRCDPQSHLLVFNHFLTNEDFEKYRHVCYPGWIIGEVNNFCQTVTTVDWEHKQTCFNFMFNKVRPHRLILSRLINYFGLTDYVYSQSWPQAVHGIQKSDSVSNLDSDTVEKICRTVQQNQNSYLLDGQTLTSDNHFILDDITKNNAEVYEKLLKKTMFEPSYISLITEPLYHEHATFITEKTIMAIYGGTVPIWIGGYGTADRMRNLGFDVFGDLVDHSYQYEQYPFDRCYQAVNKNLSILQNKTQLQDFLKKNRSRFEQNLNLLIKHKILTRVCLEKIKEYELDKIVAPQQYQQIVLDHLYDLC